MERETFFTNLNMKKSKNRVVVKTNRGNILVVTSRYAKETSELFCEDVYGALKHLGLFRF